MTSGDGRDALGAKQTSERAGSHIAQKPGMRSQAEACGAGVLGATRLREDTRDVLSSSSRSGWWRRRSWWATPFPFPSSPRSI